MGHRHPVVITMWGEERSVWQAAAQATPYEWSKFLHAMALVGLRHAYLRMGNETLAQWCDQHLEAEGLHEFKRRNA